MILEYRVAEKVKMLKHQQQFGDIRPVETKFILGGLKGEGSEERKNGGSGACPRKIFQDHAL